MRLATIDGKGNNIVRLREQPSLNSNILFTIPNGTNVIIDESENNWSKIRYLGKIGYITNEFLVENSNIPTINITEEQLLQYIQKTSELLSKLNEVL